MHGEAWDGCHGKEAYFLAAQYSRAGVPDWQVAFCLDTKTQACSTSNHFELVMA